MLVLVLVLDMPHVEMFVLKHSESAFKLFDLSSEESKTILDWRPTEPDGGASTRIEQAAAFTKTIGSRQMSGVIA